MRWFVTTKILIELFGVFLLSIEAITIPRLTALVRSIAGTAESADRARKAAAKNTVVALLFINGLFSAFLLTLLLLIGDRSSDGWGFILNMTLTDVFFGALVLISFAVFYAVRFFSRGLEASLSYIESKTPDGTIGIAGFTFVLLAAALELMLLWTPHLGGDH